MVIKTNDNQCASQPVEENVFPGYCRNCHNVTKLRKYRDDSGNDNYKCLTCGHVGFEPDYK